MTLIPAFMLSELKTAFLLGFKIYLPFLIIDMVISTVLISMGMMMLPPVLVQCLSSCFCSFLSMAGT